MIHWYHFLLDNKTIADLMRVSGLKSRKELNHFIENHHFTGKEKDSRYDHISKDMEDGRVSLWLPMPKEMYRRLKQIHQDLNYYSIAQIVRLVIHEFKVFMQNTPPQKVLPTLKAHAIRWTKALDGFRIPLKDLSHMRRTIIFSEGKLSPYLVIYNRHAVPVRKFIY